MKKIAILVIFVLNSTIFCMEKSDDLHESKYFDYVLVPSAPQQENTEIPLDVRMLRSAVMGKKYEQSLKSLAHHADLPKVDKDHEKHYRVSIILALINSPQVPNRAKVLSLLFQRYNLSPNNVQHPENGNGPMHELVKSDQPGLFDSEIGKVLLKNGLQVNGLNNAKLTPLHTALSNTCERRFLGKPSEKVEFLIKNGADPSSSELEVAKRQEYKFFKKIKNLEKEIYAIELGLKEASNSDSQEKSNNKKILQSKHDQSVTDRKYVQSKIVTLNAE